MDLFNSQHTYPEEKLLGERKAGLERFIEISLQDAVQHQVKEKTRALPGVSVCLWVSSGRQIRNDPFCFLYMML